MAGPYAGMNNREFHTKRREELLAEMRRQDQERMEFIADNQQAIMQAIQAAEARKAAALENDRSRAFSAREAAKARASSNANSAASRALTRRAQDIGREEFAQSQAFREKQRRDQLREAAQARIDRNAADTEAKVERQFNTPGTKKIQTGAGTFRTVANNDPDYKYEQHALTPAQIAERKRRRNFIRYF